MAWRIDDLVVRGEIDNTVEGKTAGKIWLAGRAEPLVLDLEGDCWRDLAGTRLTFVNPEPVREEVPGLETLQRGTVGDITASKKARVILVPEDEADRLETLGREIPSGWKPCLYLEWFSQANGRVLIESTDYRLTVSPHVWEMDSDAEQAQKLANLQAMRDAMAEMIQRLPGSRRGGNSMADDEFAWEERLKESDRLTDAYQEVLEEYMDEPGAEQKEAFAMGWDGLLEALADRPDAEGNWSPGAGEWNEFSVDGEDDGDDDGDAFRQHPLQVMAQDLALRAMDLCRSLPDDSQAADQLASSLLEVAGKLAGALGGDADRETGYVLAILKRCLNWQNDALSACAELAARFPDRGFRASLKELEASIFDLRGALVNLRAELKEN